MPLTHWLELFPESEGCPQALPRLSTEDIYTTLCQHPATWPQLLREVCIASDTEVCVRFTLFAALEDAVGRAPQNVWRAAWLAGFVRVSAHVVDDAFLCGFDRGKFNAPGTTVMIRHIALMSGIFLACTSRICDSQQPEEVSELLDVVQDTVYGVFTKLWEIKDPFLISQYTDTEDSNMKEPRFELDNLLDILSTLGYLIADQLKEYRTFALHESRIPHILLLVWIWSSQQPVRSHALTNLWQLMTIKDFDDDLWPAILRSAVVGCCAEDEVMAAILRDLADEAILDHDLVEVTVLLLTWQNSRLQFGQSLVTDRRLAPYCLAAVRRQLCRGGNPLAAKGGFYSVAMGVFSVLILGHEIPSRLCYGFFDIFCHYILLQISEDSLSLTSIKTLTAILAWGVQQLRTLRASDARPKTAVMRAHTLVAWHTVADALAHGNPALRRFARAWDVVRIHLKPARATEELREPVFGVLERCAWARCLCSRHPPAHKMRLCKGCEIAVYCGERCQKSDWETGEHRRRCRRRIV